MRVFIAVLVLIFSFQSWTKADDISDFEIEGMSIGDSLLDFFSEEELIKDFPYKNKKWATISKAVSSFKTYGGFQAHVKANDKRYIIGSIEGMILYEKNIEDCYKKQQDIIYELDNLFKKSKILEWNTPHDADPDSLVKTKQYMLQNGDIVRVTCVDWSVKKGFIDKLKVGLHSKELMQWIENEAYE